MYGLPSYDGSGTDCMVGFDSTSGSAAYCFKPHQKDGLMLAILRAQGAIPFVRSNVPQSLMLPDSSNRIYGTATNPHGFTRTPGGKFRFGNGQNRTMISRMLYVRNFLDN